MTTWLWTVKAAVAHSQIQWEKIKLDTQITQQEKHERATSELKREELAQQRELREMEIIQKRLDQEQDRDLKQTELQMQKEEKDRIWQLKTRETDLKELELRFQREEKEQERKAMFLKHKQDLFADILKSGKSLEEAQKLWDMMQP